MKWEEVLAFVQEKYSYYDTTALELSLATILSSRVYTNSPIWLLIVGVPSSGKSRMRVWFKHIKMDGATLCYPVDDFTESSIQDWAQDANQKCVLQGDMVKVLQKDSEALAAARLYYEPEVRRETAKEDRTVTRISYFSWLGFTTHFIDAYFEPEMMLGAVFLKYRSPKKGFKEQLDIVKGKKPTPQDDQAIGQKLQKFIDTLDLDDLRSIKNPLTKELATIAYAVEEMRQILKVEQKFGGAGEVVAVLPKSSEIMRVHYQAELLAQILAWFRGEKKVTQEVLKIVAKAMIGTIPEIRWAILHEMHVDDGRGPSSKGIGGCPRTRQGSLQRTFATTWTSWRT